MARATGRASRGAWSEMVTACLGAMQLPVLDGMRDGAPGWQWSPAPAYFGASSFQENEKPANALDTFERQRIRRELEGVYFGMWNGSTPCAASSLTRL